MTSLGFETSFSPRADLSLTYSSAGRAPVVQIRRSWVESPATSEINFSEFSFQLGEALGLELSKA